MSALRRLEGEDPWAPLDRGGASALYRQIAQRLRIAILAGETRLPTERELARRFVVARLTVRAALDLLATNGEITRRRRHGTVARVGVELGKTQQS